jgi:fatty acid synthase
VLAIAHPDLFLAALEDEDRDDYLRRAGRRRAQGVQRRLETRIGRPPTVRRPNPPRTRDDEAAAILKKA